MASSPAGTAVVTQAWPWGPRTNGIPGLAVWTTADGRTWHRLGPPAALARAAHVESVAVDGQGRVHVLGLTEAGLAAIWTAPSSAA